MECPEQYEVCYTPDEFDALVELLEENDLYGEYSVATENAPIGDAEAVTNFVWELLYTSPWELVYISIPMSVLAFYGLSIYAIFKWIQKKFSV